MESDKVCLGFGCLVSSSLADEITWWKTTIFPLGRANSCVNKGFSEKSHFQLLLIHSPAPVI